MSCVGFTGPMNGCASPEVNERSDVSSLNVSLGDGVAAVSAFQRKPNTLCKTMAENGSVGFVHNPMRPGRGDRRRERSTSLNIENVDLWGGAFRVNDDWHEEYLVDTRGTAASISK